MHYVTTETTTISYWEDVDRRGHWVVDHAGVRYYQGPDNFRRPIDQTLTNEQIETRCKRFEKDKEYRTDVVCDELGVSVRSGKMDLKEFVDFGYLQEVNRRFFHPVGLALAMIFDDDDVPTGEFCVLDDRDDPVGNWASPGVFTKEKAIRVQAEFDKRLGPRVQALNGVVQPL